MKSTSHISVSFGPQIPDFGSWNWVGADTAAFLADEFDVHVFDDAIPPTDIVVFIKFRPDLQVLRSVARQSAIVYCPVDVYGSEQEIFQDREALRLCDLVLIHCERLRHHFDAYACVEYLDHHLKYIAPPGRSFRSEGPLLWIGVRSNLPPVVEWVNTQALNEEFWILTNPEHPGSTIQPDRFGFWSSKRIRMAEWTPDRHIQWTSTCKAAFDVKGTDFRSAHKPPTKAMDFLASGVPIALGPTSSSAEHLARMGFEVASLDDAGRWFSHDYWEETARFGATVADLLCPDRLRVRWSLLLRQVFSTKRGTLHA
jgi:hypothetical protein